MNTHEAIPVIKNLNDRLKGLPASEVIRFFIENYKPKLGFSTSLGAEDQVITQLISKIDPGLT